MGATAIFLTIFKVIVLYKTINKAWHSRLVLEHYKVRIDATYGEMIMKTNMEKLLREVAVLKKKVD